jgi:hypothetical protein
VERAAEVAGRVDRARQKAAPGAGAAVMQRQSTHTERCRGVRSARRSTAGWLIGGDSRAGKEGNGKA